jgi:hemoglobin/transferrin/lactoferrin receptor protein
VDTSILHLPFTEARQQNITYSLNAGLIYLPDDKTKLSFDFSSGFRAPNIDDLAKVFESAGGAQIVMPNPGLKPEQTFNFEVGLSRHIGSSLYISATGFYTLFRNAVVLDKFSINGQDSIVYGGQLTPVVANQNKAGAYIYGFQGSVVYNPVKDFSLYSHLTYTFGRYKGTDNVEVPMDHIPPVYGKTGISYKKKTYGWDLYALYNGWKPLEAYNPYGEDNLRYATPYGMPSWMTLNISAFYTVTKNIKAQVAVENILDRNYRVFASGINGAGRNLVLKLNAAL